METRALIIAAGEGTRWNKYLGVDKHFIEIDGETILNRAIRLLRENGVGDIRVIGKDDRYKIDGSSLYIPKLTPEYGDADKFASSRELWSENGRTIIVYGDCFYTQWAMRKICASERRDFVLFARPFTSKFSGNGGECFVFSFYPENIYGADYRLNKLIKYYQSGILGRNGGWEWYRLHINLPIDLLDHHLVGDNFVEIYDMSEDFDLPITYDKWIEKYNALSNDEKKEL